MTKILAFALALLLLVSGWRPQFEFEHGDAVGIFVPRHILEKISVIAVVTTNGNRVRVDFRADNLSNYLWDVRYDKNMVKLESAHNNTVYIFRIKKYQQSSILMRLVVPGQFYCPEYILKIDIPEEKGGKVLYRQYVPGYAKQKDKTGFMKVFWTELFCGG